MLEQKIMNLAREGDVLTIDTLYKLNEIFKFAQKSTIKETAFELVKKGALIRLGRGKYLVIKSTENYDALKAANYIFDGYIAMASALFVYGYNQTKSFIIWGTTSSRKKIRKIGEYTYIMLPMGKSIFGSFYYKGYKISTKAKTVLDCVYNIHYVEDVTPLIDMIRDMNSEDFDELLGYLHIINNSSLTQRVGFILEKSGAPKNITTALKSVAGKSVTKLDKRIDRYINYDKNWRVFDNININRFLR